MNLFRFLYTTLKGWLDRSASNNFKFPNIHKRISNEITGEFYLDASSNVEIYRGEFQENISLRWMPILHCQDKRYALALKTGEVFYLNQRMRIDRDSILFVRYASFRPFVNDESLAFNIYITRDGFSPEILVRAFVISGEQGMNWYELKLDLSNFEGHVGSISLMVDGGSSVNSSTESIAISDFCVSRSDRLSLVQARSFHAMRAANEIAHFSSVYKHEMYLTNHGSHRRRSMPVIRKLAMTHDFSECGRLETVASSDILPLTNESTHAYASRLLDMRLSIKKPDFLDRLNEKAMAGRRLRVLSLCSGAARIEAGLASEVCGPVDWSLLDINSELLKQAALQFPDDVQLDLIEGNVNDLTRTSEKWDVILCVSALHHLVELEKVIRFCHDSLSEDGEFWSIGEYVGRNGNRLWPEARSVANSIFSALPERYRLNSHTGSIDAELPDNDYSVGTFEGIRSEEIEPIVSRWFRCECALKRNSFLWRLTNLAYADNYNLQDVNDRLLIGKMVDAEVNHFNSTRRGTELYAVYRPL